MSKALLTIPKTLAINAALDAIDLLAALRVRRCDEMARVVSAAAPQVRHHASQQASDPKKKDYKWYGLDLINGTVRNQAQTKRERVSESLGERSSRISRFAGGERGPGADGLEAEVPQVCHRGGF